MMNDYRHIVMFSSKGNRRVGRKEGRKEGEKSKVENQIKEKDDKKEIQNLLLSVFGFSF